MKKTVVWCALGLLAGGTALAQEAVVNGGFNDSGSPAGFEAPPWCPTLGWTWGGTRWNGTEGTAPSGPGCASVWDGGAWQDNVSVNTLTTYVVSADVRGYAGTDGRTCEFGVNDQRFMFHQSVTTMDYTNGWRHVGWAATGLDFAWAARGPAPDYVITHGTYPVQVIVQSSGGVTACYVDNVSVKAAPNGLSIFLQPQNLSKYATRTAVLSVGATAVGDANPVTYLWQKKDAGGTFVDLSDIGNIVGSTSNLLTIANLSSSDAGDYRAKVTADTSTTSAAATLTVLPLPHPQLSLSVKPAITITNGTVGFHYQVQYSVDSGATWALLQNIPSLPSNPYTVYDPAGNTPPSRIYQAVVLP
jgi:hypothetical protein